MTVTLAQSISAAHQKELESLAAYVAGELEMEGVDIGESPHRDIEAEAVRSAIRAWAFTQQNTPDGDA